MRLSFNSSPHKILNDHHLLLSLEASYQLAEWIYNNVRQKLGRLKDGPDGDAEPQADDSSGVRYEV